MKLAAAQLVHAVAGPGGKSILSPRSHRPDMKLHPDRMDPFDLEWVDGMLKVTVNAGPAVGQVMLVPAANVKAIEPWVEPVAPVKPAQKPQQAKGAAA